jgi:signal transduction histidine kinase/PAS domain-containing protein
MAGIAIFVALTKTVLKMWLVTLLILAALLAFVCILWWKARTQAEQLRDVDTFHKALWKNAHASIFLVDGTAKVVRTNYYALSGQPEVKNPRCLGYILQCRYKTDGDNCAPHEKCAECPLRQCVDHAFKTKSSFENKEIRMQVHPPGKVMGVYDILVSGRYLKMNGKDFVALTISDTTLKHELENSLKQTNEKFLCFFNNVTVGCAICSNDGYLVEVNDAYLEYMGISSRDDIVRLNIFSNPCISGEFKHMMRTGIPVYGEVKYDYKRLNREYVKTKRRDVRYFYFIVNYLRNASGGVENILIIWMENTLVHGMLEENAIFRDMISAASSFSRIGFFSVNLMTSDRRVTKEYLHNLGMAPNTNPQTIAATVMQLYPEDSREVLEYVSKCRVQRMDPFEGEYKVTVDGESKWTKLYLFQYTFKPEENEIMLLSVNMDITTQKAAEERLREAKESAESSDRLKSAFLDNMSHEIRTPLNAIIGFSHLLTQSEDPEEKEMFKQVIEQNSEQLLQLVGDILELSRLESGDQSFRWEEVDVNGLMEDMYQQYMLKNKNPDVTLVYQPREHECLMTTAPARIRQILGQLLSNALKFTSDGVVEMGFEMRGDKVYFFVSDTGCGVPEEQRDEIFQRFVKLNSFKPGTGLGLPICGRLVAALGGEIGVKPNREQGSIFWFILPMKGGKN